MSDIFIVIFLYLAVVAAIVGLALAGLDSRSDDE